MAIADGNPHLYGTYASAQPDGTVHWDHPVRGRVAEVDARRAQLGLPPLADDLSEPQDAAPYRSQRLTPAFAWPSAT